MVFYMSYMCFNSFVYTHGYLYLYICLYIPTHFLFIYVFIYVYTYISICVHICVSMFFHMIHMLTAQVILNAFSKWFFNDRCHWLPIITFFHVSITFVYI